MGYLCPSVTYAPRSYNHDCLRVCNYDCVTVCNHDCLRVCNYDCVRMCNHDCVRVCKCVLVSFRMRDVNFCNCTTITYSYGLMVMVICVFVQSNKRTNDIFTNCVHLKL